MIILRAAELILKSLIVFIFVLPALQLVAQTPIDVVERTFKVAPFGEEVFYYGFAEGDQVIFNFQVVKGRALKEVEIVEFPASSKFMDYKSKKIENKRLTISKTGVYTFRFLNSAVGGRICKLNIQRIPANESTEDFNTSVYWKTVYDTTYTTVQQRYLVSRDTAVQNITDQVLKVHSSTNLNGNKSSFNFTLPANTVSWSYYIGVDQAGQQAYEKATRQLAKYAAPMFAKLPGYGPLAAVALGGASYIAVLQRGEDIDYYLCDGDNAYLFMNDQAFRYMKKSKVINDFSRMTNNLSGSYHFCFYNDNAVTGVSVAVKVTAITVTEKWGMRPVEKMNVTAREVPYLK